MVKDHFFEEEMMMRLKGWHEKNYARPFRMILFPTNLCNLNCVYCKGRDRRNTNPFELKDKKWMEIVKWGLKNNVREWWITGGGEPLIRKVTLKMIKMIKSEPGTHCELMTNGTLFTPQLIKEFVKIKMDKIMISIDAPIEETNNLIRGGDSFKKTVESIKLFKKNKQRNFPVIQIRTTLTSRITDKIHEFVNFSSKIGADELAIHPLHVYEYTKENVGELIVKKSQYRELLEGIKKGESVSKQLNFKFDHSAIDCFFNLEKDVNNLGAKRTDCNFLSALCFEPWYNILITADGRIAPCCPGGAETNGPGVCEKSLEEIWTGNYFTEIRNTILQNRMPFKICRECGVKNITIEIREKLSQFIK